MPTKIRNIIFITICICTLSIAFIYLGAKKATVLPSSFINETYSYLEGTKLQARPEISLDNIKKGIFQKQTEKWLTTKVPKRDSVLLFNAKVQRGVIKTANSAFGFDTIPTFFGSDYSYVSRLNYLVQNSIKNTKERIQHLNDSASAINEFESEHKNLKFTIALVERINYTEANPTYSLISDAEGKDDRWNNFASKLDPQIDFIDLSIKDEEMRSKLFFKSDHHWNITGASIAFQKIMNEAYPELTQAEFGEITIYDKPAFYGTLSRNGLMADITPDSISDYIIDMSDIQIEINNKESKQEDVEHIMMYNSESWKKERFQNRYGEYFHGDVAKIVFSSAKQTGRNLLLIGDSYSNLCDRFFAKSFDNVVEIDQRTNKESLDELIKSYGITDVLFLSNYSILDKGRDVLTKWSSN